MKKVLRICHMFITVLISKAEGSDIKHGKTKRRKLQREKVTDLSCINDKAATNMPTQWLAS